MTKAELEAQIASYLHRTDLTAADLTGFINRAMDRVKRTLRPQQAEYAVSPILFAGTAGIFSLPTDYGTARAVYWDGSQGTAELKPMSSIEAAKWEGHQSAIPLGYRITEGFLRTFPKVSTGIRLVYWADPAPLVAAGDTNWVTDGYPTLALYGSLIEGSIWEQNPQMTQQYTVEFNTAMAEAEREAERASYGAAPVASSHYQAPGTVTRSM
jgi:hypothetical protein